MRRAFTTVTTVRAPDGSARTHTCRGTLAGSPASVLHHCHWQRADVNSASASASGGSASEAVFELARARAAAAAMLSDGNVLLQARVHFCANM